MNVLQREYNFILFGFVALESQIEIKFKLPPEDIESKNTIVELDIRSIRKIKESRDSNHAPKGKSIQWKFLIMMRTFLKNKCVPIHEAAQVHYLEAMAL